MIPFSFCSLFLIPSILLPRLHSFFFVWFKYSPFSAVRWMAAPAAAVEKARSHQYRQLLRSASGGAVCSIRLTARGMYIWW
jgi:hypothetical protein